MLRSLKLVKAFICSIIPLVQARNILQAGSTMNAPVLTEAAPAGLQLPGAAAAAAVNATMAAAEGDRTFATFGEALQAANITNDLSILVQAVQVAGVVVNDTATWTILAPTNRAFKDRLQNDLKIMPAQLLQNRTRLLEILSYHVIPSGAFLSSNLTDGQTLRTALAGAPPLAVKVDRTFKHGTSRPVPQIEFDGAGNKAEVRRTGADIRAGASVIHVVNDLLLPPGLGPAASLNTTDAASDE